ncbi:hypothetical protein B0H14DRAFT_2671087 [Mycena olivaceomarginata]|nr:hypothetical protein B0H14DRAFT_2671087 [Mycena olivaceomarginata]
MNGHWCPHSTSRSPWPRCPSSSRSWSSGRASRARRWRWPSVRRVRFCFVRWIHVVRLYVSFGFAYCFGSIPSTLAWIFVHTVNWWLGCGGVPCLLILCYAT